jgi:hypothetical protein
MTEAQMGLPAGMPAELAERLYDQADMALPDPAPYLDQAREEIAESIIYGEGRLTFTDVLGDTLDGSFKQTVDTLGGKLMQIANSMGDEKRLLVYDLEAWMRGIVDAYITDDMVQEKACQIADDSGAE